MGTSHYQFSFVILAKNQRLCVPALSAPHCEGRKAREVKENIFFEMSIVSARQLHFSP